MVCEQVELTTRRHPRPLNTHLTSPRLAKVSLNSWVNNLKLNILSLFRFIELQFIHLTMQAPWPFRRNDRTNTPHRNQTFESTTEQNVMCCGDTRVEPGPHNPLAKNAAFSSRQHRCRRTAATPPPDGSALAQGCRLSCAQLSRSGCSRNARSSTMALPRAARAQPGRL